MIYKEDITWDDDDLKPNVIFGKMMGDEESVKEIQSVPVTWFLPCETDQ